MQAFLPACILQLASCSLSLIKRVGPGQNVRVTWHVDSLHIHTFLFDSRLSILMFTLTNKARGYVRDWRLWEKSPCFLTRVARARVAKACTKSPRAPGTVPLLARAVVVGLAGRIVPDIASARVVVVGRAVAVLVVVGPVGVRVMVATTLSGGRSASAVVVALAVGTGLARVVHGG